MENSPVTASVFDEKTVPLLLKNLNEDAKPSWGKMTAQHMLEHLGNTLVLASSGKDLKCVTPEEKLPAFKQFLMSNQPFKQNIPNPFIGDGLPTLRFPDLETAKIKLIQAMEKFHAFFQLHPEAKPVHPFFGNLNYEEWKQFQKKHFEHHFRQFNVLPEAQTV